MLPIESVSSEVLTGLEHNNIVLIAPPGAGKSTYLPLELLRMKSLGEQKIIMLQPRRVAVRAIAGFLAKQLGESVGQTVGYRVRGESNVSNQTRLEIVTEGLLTRMVQGDPELTGVGLVIFDEFHERNVHADLGLAFCIESQLNLRENLRLLVMSATLEAKPLLTILPDALLIQCEGRSFPVETLYRPFPPQSDLATASANVAIEALQTEQGNILVFLPGAYEIQKCQRILQSRVPDNTQIFMLYGALSKELQQQAIASTSGPIRKVVLSTNIAETSLTIEGIRVVIDSGQEKSAFFHLSKGITKLQQHSISEASSIQRQGRAGRLEPGLCFRLWDREKQARLVKQIQPEILQQDLCQIVLEAAAWGTQIRQLPLLDVPSDAQLEHAHLVLRELQAFNPENKITSHGRAIANLGVHPRLANVMLKARDREHGLAVIACLVCALLEGTTRKQSEAGVEIHALLEALLNQRQDERWRTAKQWYRRLNISQDFSVKAINASDVALLVAFAYPDRIAKKTGENRFLLANGSGANLAQTDPLKNSDWLAIGDLSLGKSADARITLAQPVAFELVELEFSHMFEQREVCEWREKDQRIVAEKQQFFGHILLSRQSGAKPETASCLAIWQKLISENGLSFLSWDDSTENLFNRMKLLSTLEVENWPDVSDNWMLKNLQHWCGFELGQLQSKKQLLELDWHQLLLNMLDWPNQQRLEELAPRSFNAPSGNNHKLRYGNDGSVSLSIRMQELYGLNDTPRIARGGIPVSMQILSPAHRPIQLTKDLAGFWMGSYKEVQKEMKGRYPKHFWPDDPANAKATTRTKKNM